MSLFYQVPISIMTPGRSLTNVTNKINEVLLDYNMQQGLCNVFLHHTSASLILSENFDVDVCRDLENFFNKLVPDGDSIYLHTAEGEDDMSAHIRSVLTTNSLTIPITNAQLSLGSWQGIFLWEHRKASYTRNMTITLQGC